MVDVLSQDLAVEGRSQCTEVGVDRGREVTSSLVGEEQQNV